MCSSSKSSNWTLRGQGNIMQGKARVHTPRRGTADTPRSGHEYQNHKGYHNSRNNHATRGVETTTGDLGIPRLKMNSSSFSRNKSPQGGSDRSPCRLGNKKRGMRSVHSILIGRSRAHKKKQLHRKMYRVIKRTVGRNSQPATDHGSRTS